MALGLGRRTRLRDVRCCFNWRRQGLVSVCTAILVCGLLTASTIVGAQPNDALMAEATAPLDEDVRDGAMVYVEDAEGNRRVLRWGTNGWICGLSRVPTQFAQCYEGEARQLFMSVVDQPGQPVLDVRADEVSLEQSGALCTVVGLHTERVPMKVALLVDNSDAAEGSLTSLRNGLLGFLDMLPPQHEVGLFTIASQTRQRVDFTTDRDELKKQAEALFVERNSVTVFLDGLVETWERRFDANDPWPVFVVVVYNGPEGSRRIQEEEFYEFTREFAARAATVHAILLSVQPGATPLLQRRSFPGGQIQTRLSVFLTENTGGIYRALAAPTALPEALAEVVTAMRTQYGEVKDRYKVVYECDSDNAAAAVKVGVRRPGVTVALFPDRRSDR